MVAHRAATRQCPIAVVVTQVGAIPEIAVAVVVQVTAALEIVNRPDAD